MSTYGTVAFAFHGRPDELKELAAAADKQLAPWFSWAKGRTLSGADGMLTVYQQIHFDLKIEEFLEGLDKLAQVKPEVEIAAMVEFASSVSDGYDYTAFYSPAGSVSIRNPDKKDWTGPILYHGLDGEMDNYEGCNGGPEHAGFYGWMPDEDPDDDPPDDPDWITQWEEHVRIHVVWEDDDEWDDEC